MDENAAPETKVPIKVPEPEEHAPPTLAEPASGPVAEMSGALTGGQTSETPAPAAPSVEPSVPNGDVQAAPASAVESAPPPSQPSSAAEPASEPAQTTQEAPTSTDSEMKEAADQSADTPPADDAAGQKKGGNGNGKRKSSGIPEHKNKKVNKKKSMTKITHLDAQPGDVFFARLKSYPPWPSVICDEEMLPTSLLNTRPVTTKKNDGTYNEAYADGGKKVADRTFPVMFLYTNEFAWIPNTDLGDLNPEDCKDVAEKGKAKSLIAAYHVAAENHDLQYFKDMLLDHAKAMEEDDARKAELQAEKAEKATKKKRKSEAKVEDDDVDMEDADDAAEVKKSSKKRKKAAESEDEGTEKPAKTPKTTKLKLTTNKTPATSEKKSKDKPAKPKSEKKKSKAAVEDEEMADAPEPEPEQPMDPEEARKAREREVLFLRHKLQKGFLARDQAPQDEDMPQMSNYIKKLEAYEDLEVSIIRQTKINKVLKALVKLNTIPKDEEFNFRKRSMELLSRWNKILGAEPHESETAEAKTPTTNGVHEGTEGPPVDDSARTEPEKVVEPESASTKLEAALPTSAEDKQPTVEDSTPAPVPPKSDEAPAVAPESVAVEKAPQSAQAASEVAEVVKTAE